MTERAGVALSAQLGWRGLRWWRVMTLGAFAFTFIATHIPRLSFGPEAPSDKVLHATTFGILTLLLARARVFNHLVVLVAMVAFSVFDEATQSLPFIHRHTSMADWIADCVGTLVAWTLLCMQVRPRDEVGRMRGEFAGAARAAVLDRPFNWFALQTSAILGALVGFPLAIVLEHTLFLESSPWKSGFVGGVFGAFVGLEIAHRAACRALTTRLSDRRACFGCGASTLSANDAHGSASGTCASCGAPWRRAQWVVPCALFDHARWKRVCMSARSGAIGGVIVLFSILAFAGVIRAAMGALALSPISGSVLIDLREIREVIVGPIAILSIALIMRVMNRSDARARSREGVRCLSCDFDLRATPAPSGVGRCPECATEFARIATGDETALSHFGGGAKPSTELDGCPPV